MNPETLANPENFPLILMESYDMFFFFLQDIVFIFIRLMNETPPRGGRSFIRNFPYFKLTLFGFFVLLGEIYSMIP